MNHTIGDIAEATPTLPTDSICEQANQLFGKNSKLQGIVVVSSYRPVGLISRPHFYQKIGTLYGYNLYMRRSIDLVVNKKPLIVDYMETITSVSEMAMTRKDEELYDDVIVTKNDEFFGVVSIRNLLLRFADIQAEIASFLNPLTGLPGNRMIEEKIEESLQRGGYSILYIDLDNFKSYNDTYGFNKGDQLIKRTATILKKHLFQQEDFLGHIGGDDYIAILDHYDFKKICLNIIKDFEEAIKEFYSKNHYEQKYIFATNREGRWGKIPLVSISIAVITDQIKAYNTIDEISNEATKIKHLCKKEKRSCYYVSIGIEALRGTY